MIGRLRERLVPTDGLERHICTARLLGHPATVVDVGGYRGQLDAHLPGAAITSVNVDGEPDVIVEPGPHPLPFADGAFEAAASLDTLEHIPRADRPGFVAELLRVTARRVVLCCPLGTPARTAVEAADNAWYRELTGDDHPWISEHIEHGPPTLEDLQALFTSPDHDVTFRFNGDLHVTSRQFRMAERSNVTRNPVAMARWAAYRLPKRPDVALSDRPAPDTNRVFVIADRR
jgi:hypothetical protein